MKTLIRNALVIPMTERNLSYRGSILIEDGILRMDADPCTPCDRIIDGSGKIAMPSFINAHTHLPMVLMRNYKDTCNELMEWLSQIFPIEDKLNGDDIYYASLLGAAELIDSGCTCFADMYFFAHNTVRAAREAGIRGIISQTLFGDRDEAERRIRERLPLIEEEADGDDSFRVDIAVHAIYTCTEGCYRTAHEWAHENGRFLHTHCSETMTEVNDSIREHGMRPVEYLDSSNVLDDRTYLAHCVHLTDNEIAIIRERGCSAVHNPTSNCKLASGIAPVRKLRESGVNVALGTDGASSNNNLNMMKEINIASLISTVSNMSPSANTPYDILEMATINGARALGIDDKVGTLESGKSADLILIDTDSVNMTPLNDPFSAIVFSADRKNIDTVFCRGRMLKEKGELLTLDRKEIQAKTEECWNSILSR